MMRGSSRIVLWPFALGALLGGLGAASSQLEIRWVVYLCLALALAVVFLAIPRKEAFLFSAFFLAFQVDVYVRPFFGAGGGSAGLEFPLVFFVGLALSGWCIFTWPVARRREIALAGALRWPILAMLATTGLSFLFASERFLALDRLLFEIQLFGAYWITLNVVRSEADVKRVLSLMFITLAVQSLVYFVESALGVNFTFAGETLALGETPRPGGTVSSNPAGYTSFVMPILTIAMAFFVSRRPGMKIPLLPLLILVGVASIGLSYTRAAWIGLGLGLVVICVVTARNRQLRTARTALIVLSAGLGVMLLVPILIARLQSDYGGQSTMEERWNLMVIALNVIRANPIVGVGPNAYGDLFKLYLPSGLGTAWLYTVHNEFLLRAAETGIAGGVALVALVAAAYRCAGRVARTEQSALGIVGIGWMGGLTAVVWQMCWVPWRGFSYNAIFWMFLGLMDACDRIRQMNAFSAAAVASTPALQETPSAVRWTLPDAGR